MLKLTLERTDLYFSLGLAILDKVGNLLTSSLTKGYTKLTKD